MSCRLSLSAFVAAARSAFTSSLHRNNLPLSFVVGNEASDLDSLCSTLLLAYFRSQHSPSSPSSLSSPTLHFPLCNLPRVDLKLRPEFSALLSDASINPSDLLTLDDLPEADTLPPSRTRWIPVDHNALTGRLGEHFTSRIVGCIDHHVDEGVVPPASECEVRMIEKAGSCISLIISAHRDAWDSYSDRNASKQEDGTREPPQTRPADDDDPAAFADAQIARVALGPILIDTANLQNPDKTTAWDEDAVAYLEQKVRRGEASPREELQPYDRTAFYNRLMDLLGDISTFTPRDLLRKDYKAWTEAGLILGTSAEPRDLASLLAQARGKDAFLTGIREWGSEKELDLVVVMTAFYDGKDGNSGFRRELMVCAKTESGVRVAKAFEEKCGPELRLKVWGEGKLDCEEEEEEDGEGSLLWRKCWVQENLAASRKQVAPKLREVMREVA